AELLLARHEATHATAEAADLKTAYDAVARQAAARDAYLKDHAEEVARLERVERAAESALAARMRRIGAEPPAYIIDKLGHVPSSGAARNAWWSAAKSIETYRAIAGVDSQHTALGGRPEEPALRQQWHRVHADLDTTGRVIRTAQALDRTATIARDMPQISRGIEL